MMNVAVSTAKHTDDTNRLEECNRYYNILILHALLSQELSIPGLDQFLTNAMLIVLCKICSLDWQRRRGLFKLSATPFDE